MLPIWAIIERDLRKYFRSPALILVSLFLPLLQLVIIGYALAARSGRVGRARVADRGAAPASREVHRDEANARPFAPPADDPPARCAARNGDVAATVIIPEDYSRKIGQRVPPKLGLVLDNTDPFVGATLTAKMNELLAAVNAPDVSPRYLNGVALDVVEIFPYVEYIEYLLPGSITLAIFVCALIGGGIIFIDDKARGLHEGYLVTPISKLQLVMGMLLSGTIKASFAGTVVVVLGSIIADQCQSDAEHAGARGGLRRSSPSLISLISC